jgi:hypothetical protein
MANPLHSWKQQGVVRLWRYTEFKQKFGGWHLTADDAGVASLLALLPLLTDAPEEYRSVAVTPPTAAVLRVPNYSQGLAQWTAPAKWHIRASPALNTWLFPAGDPADLTFGVGYLAQLTAALQGIPRGEGDFCVSKPKHGSLPLWFWWHPNAA